MVEGSEVGSYFNFCADLHFIIQSEISDSLLRLLPIRSIKKCNMLILEDKRYNLFEYLTLL